jgi:hypothetical protein
VANLFGHWSGYRKGKVQILDGSGSTKLPTGFVVDSLAEAREMPKHNFTEVTDRHFSLGAH